MSISYYPFTPTVSTNYTFTPTLDGSQYIVTARWNVFGRRWVVFVYTLAGALVVAKPLRSSPDGVNIDIVKGYFASSYLVYRASSDTFEVGP